VFPTLTSFTPTDENAYTDIPTLFTPHYDKALVSCTFTWDIEKAHWLASQWRQRAKRVVVGGVAFNDRCDDFTPGMFIKAGCVFTSRGCINNCWYCSVPAREGTIRELPVVDGNVIMDNNLLACSEKHIAEVFRMLSDKHQIEFNGGLDARLITKEVAFEMRKIMKRTKRLWSAYDRPGDLTYIKKAFKLLHEPKNKFHVYVLSAYDSDTCERAEERCMQVAKIGAYPFMMLYQPGGEKKQFSKQWRDLRRKWTRPAAWKGGLS
jgi:hypothetical protein